MCPASPIPPDRLRRRCDPATIPFETTAEVATDWGEIVGQDRAIGALRFGVGIRREGYNLFAIGPHGTGKQALLRQLLDRQAAAESPPGDRCYVAGSGRDPASGVKNGDTASVGGRGWRRDD